MSELFFGHILDSQRVNIRAGSLLLWKVERKDSDRRRKWKFNVEILFLLRSPFFFQNESDLGLFYFTKKIRVTSH